MTSNAAAPGGTIDWRIACLTGGFIFLFLISVAFAISAAIAAAAHDPATNGYVLCFLFTATAASLWGAAAIDLIIGTLTKS